VEVGEHDSTDRAENKELGVCGRCGGACMPAMPWVRGLKWLEEVERKLSGRGTAMGGPPHRATTPWPRAGGKRRRRCAWGGQRSSNITTTDTTTTNHHQQQQPQRIRLGS